MAVRWKLLSRVQNQSHLQNSPRHTPTLPFICQAFQFPVGNHLLARVSSCTDHLLSLHSDSEHPALVPDYFSVPGLPVLQRSPLTADATLKAPLVLRTAGNVYWVPTMCQALGYASDPHCHVITAPVTDMPTFRDSHQRLDYMYILHSLDWDPNVGLPFII